MAKLVYLYGPPAAGKLTVATALAERTGYRLFHNHLTVNAIAPVFGFGTPAFERLLGLFRREIFETAMQVGVDLIFTNNSAWPHENPRERFSTYAATIAALVDAAKGRTYFVNITAPTEVLLDRVGDESRRAHGKLVDSEELRARLATFDPTPLHPDHLVVDTSVTDPTDAASLIAAYINHEPAGSDHRDITRRPATAADAAWARRVHHAAVRDVVERQFGSWDEAQQDRFFDSDWSGGDFDVIEYRGVPCGYVCIEDRPDDVHVREIDIDPAYQGRGVGTSIIRSAIERARERGVPVVLGTLHENRAAGLYRRLGFTETGRTDTHTLFRHDP